jgi:hypothetical protein
MIGRYLGSAKPAEARREIVKIETARDIVVSQAARRPNSQ